MSLRILQTERVKKSSNHNHGSGALLFSAGYWIKPIGATTFAGDDLSNHNGLHRHRGNTGNVPQERIWTNPSGVLSMTSSTAFTNDAWNFVVVTSDSTTGQKVYLNGVEVATASVAEAMATIANTAEYLGDAVPNWDAGESAYFGGIFRMAGKALSLAEVQALYANRSGGGGTTKPTDHAGSGITIHCAPFDQTSGSVTNGDTGLADLGDVANNWVLSTGTPAWVNDDPGHNWSSTAPAWEYTPTVPAYRIPSTIANLLHGGDCRVLTLGDSFNRWFLPARLFPFGWLLADAAVNMTAFCCGDALAAANGLVRAYNAATGTTFDVSDGSYEIENGSGTYFALPVSEIRGIYCDVGLTLNGGTRFVQYRWRNAALATSGRRNWISATDQVKARLLFLAAAAGANQLPDIQLKDVNAATTVDCDFTVDGCRSDDTSAPAGEAVSDGEINACYPDILLTNSSSEFHLDILKGATDPVGTNQFLQIAGALVYKVDGSGNRIPGLYYSTLDGNSWSYVGFTANTAAGAGQKQFARTQIRPWLARTTLDPGQRLVIIQNIADEANSQANHKTKMEALITEGDAWASGITTQPPLYLFIIQFAHEISGVPEDEMQNQLDKAAAAYEIAQANSRVGYISLYQMMEGNYATDDVSSGYTGGLAAYAAWATARGWDSFTNEGTYAGVDLSDGLLDPDLHIGGTEEATAIGSLIAEAITRSAGGGARDRGRGRRAMAAVR